MSVVSKVLEHVFFLGLLLVATSARAEDRFSLKCTGQQTTYGAGLPLLKSLTRFYTVYAKTLSEISQSPLIPGKSTGLMLQLDYGHWYDFDTKEWNQLKLTDENILTLSQENIPNFYWYDFFIERYSGAWHVVQRSDYDSTKKHFQTSLLIEGSCSKLPQLRIPPAPLF